jgi:hypothetical protein
VMHHNTPIHIHHEKEQHLKPAPPAHHSSRASPLSQPEAHVLANPRSQPARPSTQSSCAPLKYPSPRIPAPARIPPFITSSPRATLEHSSPPLKPARPSPRLQCAHPAQVHKPAPAHASSPRAPAPAPALSLNLKQPSLSA